MIHFKDAIYKSIASNTLYSFGFVAKKKRKRKQH